MNADMIREQLKHESRGQTREALKLALLKCVWNELHGHTIIPVSAPLAPTPLPENPFKVCTDAATF